MFKIAGRISCVKSIKILGVGLSSTILVGDSVHITPYSQAIAVQREAPLFFGREGRFIDYPIFSKYIPLPVITEDIDMVIDNKSPLINVGNIYILGAGASAVVQIGSTEHICAESRIKHIRQLLDRD